MTIAFGASTAAVTQATIAVPAHSNGDFLLLFVCRSFASTGTPDWPTLIAAGWNFLSTQGTINSNLTAVLWKEASSEPGTYADPCVAVGGNRVLIMQSYSGVDMADPIQAYRTRENASTTSHAIGPLLVRASHTGMEVGCASMARGTSTTAPGTFTSAGTGTIGGSGTSNTAARAAYRQVTAGSYPSANFGSGNSAASYTWHLCLKAADQPLATAVRDFSYENGVTPIMPSATMEGDFLLAVLSSRAAGTISEPGGWNVCAGNVSQAGYSQNAFWRFADAADVAARGTAPYTFTTPAGTVTEFFVLSAARFGTAASVADTSSGTSADLPALTFSAQSPDALMWAFCCSRADIDAGVGTSGYTGFNRITNGAASGNIFQESFFGWSAGPDAAASTLSLGGASVSNEHHIMIRNYQPGGASTQVVWTE